MSVVILTYKSTELFANLLSTVISQKQDYFEVIIVDAGCLDEIKEVINKYFPKNSQREKRLKYLPQCDMMNGSGDEIDEAGSIVCSDGSAAGFGRGRKDINSSEFRYARLIDYISGACIMVRKPIFGDYGGFDAEHFPSYYKDTVLQKNSKDFARKWAF